MSNSSPLSVSVPPTKSEYSTVPLSSPTHDDHIVVNVDTNATPGGSTNVRVSTVPLKDESGQVVPSIKSESIPPSHVVVNIPPPFGSARTKSAQSRSEMEMGRKDYMNLMKLMKECWSDLPQLTITYEDLSYTLTLPAKEQNIPNLIDSLLSLKNILKPAKTKQLPALERTTGLIKPGEMVLILAPPGHGKSTFLKSLAGRHAYDKNLGGTIRYNGFTYDEAAKAGLHVEKMTAFVDQGDIHMPLLTVRETLAFAVDNSVADPRLLENPAIATEHAKRVDFVIELLGLKECADTILGNDLIRGVSGGQKKRVTIGEMLITNARALFLDEITTGLDAAASYDILQALQSWCRFMGGSVVSALLQPTPECFDLFDRVIFLRYGTVIYDGPMSEARKYIEGIGVPVSHEQDFADFMVDYLTDPKLTYYRQLYRAAKRAGKVPDAVSATSAPGEVLASPEEEKENQTSIQASPTTPANLLSPKSQAKAASTFNTLSTTNAPLTTAALHEAFLSSTIYADVVEQVKQYNGQPHKINQLTSYTQNQFGQFNSRSPFHLIGVNVGRSGKNMARNGGFWGPRLFQSVFLGFILGGLFYQISPNDYRTRFGLILSSIVQVAFANAAELPFASADKRVVFKQVDAGFYPTYAYVVAVVLVHFPLSLAETFIFSSIVYWMSGFSDNAGDFFFFYLCIWSSNVCFSLLFRSIAYATAHEDIANQTSGPVTAFLFLFCGYLVLYNNIPRWLIWMYEFSPFTWLMRSIGQSEYHNSRFDYPAASDASETQGDAFLRAMDVDPTSAYKWAGVGYVWGIFFVFLLMGTAILSKVRYPLTMGTRRIEDEDDELVEENQTNTAAPSAPNNIASPKTVTVKTDKAVAIAQKYASSFRLKSHSTALPFQKVDLAWKDIKYTVVVTKDGKKENRLLLNNVSGFAKAGSLTALMGSSGAGKTTLMDCIAGRKTAGILEGEIFVNGYPKVKRTFNRLVGYVEQSDIHLAQHTVREALHFSARLRLPREVQEEQRTAFVEEVLQLLELDKIGDRIIGNSSQPGLSPGQLKRVTIGVELVANPPILFLDEPTSGLDSRAALVVMRVIKRISATGRSVLCTIHQPSAELFSMFDRLLLLKSGGVDVFFGDVGHDGVELVRYFETAPIDTSRFHQPIKPPQTNPASWMLEVIGAGTGIKLLDKELADYAEIYNSSKLKEENVSILQTLIKPKPGTDAPSFEHTYAASAATQYQQVIHRVFLSYWRNPGFVWVRQGLMLFTSIVFGLLYLQIGIDSQGAVQSKYSGIFVGLIFPGWVSMSSIIPLIFAFRVVFYREQASFMYEPGAYIVAIGVVEIFYTALSAIIFVLPFYFLIGFANDANLFFKYYLMQYIQMYIWLSVGQWVSSMVPAVLVANIVSSIIGIFTIIFAGIYIAPAQIAVGWKWIYWMDWTPKALIALGSTQFACDGDVGYSEGGNCPEISVVGNDGASTLQTVQDYIFAYADTEGVQYWNYIGWCLLTIFIFRIFIYLAIKNINFMKR